MTEHIPPGACHPQCFPQPPIGADMWRSCCMRGSGLVWELGWVAAGVCDATLKPTAVDDAIIVPVRPEPSTELNGKPVRKVQAPIWAADPGSRVDR